MGDPPGAPPPYGALPSPSTAPARDKLSQPARPLAPSGTNLIMCIYHGFQEPPHYPFTTTHNTYNRLVAPTTFERLLSCCM